MPTLVIQLPNMPPVEHVLRDDAVTIGRMKGNTIALDDISVSLSHAKLTRRDGDYYLKDLNSTNGTMLNGQSVAEARLHDGDFVKFGEVTGRFYATAAPVVPNTTSGAANASPSVPTAPMASPPAVPARALPSPVASSSAAQTGRPPKSFPLIPVLAGAGGLVLAGFLAWKFFLNEAAQPEYALPSAATTAAVPPNSPAKPKTSSPVTFSAPMSVAPTTVASRSMPRDVPALIGFLKSSDVVERRQAAATLNSMGASVKEAVPALREAVKDSDSEVRMWAALSLINNSVYDKATVPILIQLLRHESPVMRQVACLSLALIPYGEPEKDPVISALTELAGREENEEVRAAAISAMKVIASPSAPSGR